MRPRQLSHQWCDFFVALVSLLELPHAEQVSLGKTTSARLRLRNIGSEPFDDPISPFCRLDLAADGCADLPVEINQLGIDGPLTGGGYQPDDLGERCFVVFRCSEIRRLGSRWQGPFPDP